MIKVAIWFDAPAEYSGGLNYMKNLLYALSLVNDGSIRPYIFFSHGISKEIESQFAPVATVIRTKLLQRGTAARLVQMFCYKIFGSMGPVNALLKSHGISILSHVWFVYKGKVPFRIIGWIPDFQYLHLPQLFPDLNTENETRQNRKIIAQSDALILSSHNAFEDFKRIAAPEHQSRGAVLQFVSQPRTVEPSLTLEAIELKYGFYGKFFFLPNQFWAHKNHLVVFQAVKLLKRKGINVLVLCTGNTRDYRVTGTEYIDSIYAFIETNDLQDNVKILGHIDYGNVLLMMKNSLAVLNPSRFEGWSSSVEEAKSIGKPVILSRIGVHLEQNPPNGRYFDPDDAIALSRILAETWSASADQPQHDDLERIAQDNLKRRTLEFGDAYFKLLHGAIPRSAPSADPGMARTPA